MVNSELQYFDMDTPAWCRYEIIVTYHGKRNTHIDKELLQSVIFTRMLVAGRGVQVEQRSPIVRTGAASCDSWKIEGFFPVPLASTFTIYIGFKSPGREGILLEVKVHPSQFAKCGYDCDILGRARSQAEFDLSLEMQLLCADRRIDISHKTKTKTTSLYRIPSSDESNESLYREKQFLQKLVRPPMNKARAATSILNGWLLFSQWESTNHIQYLDLSIQALSAGHAYPRDCGQPPHSHIIFCDILFNRCTLPNGDSFVSNAFDALTKLDTIPDLDDEILEPFVEVVLQVLRKHHDPNYATTVFRVLAPSICALCQSRKTVPEFLVQATLFAFDLAPKAEETLMILDSTLQFISPVLPVNSNGKLSLSGAFSRLALYEDERSPCCDVVMITA